MEEPELAVCYLQNIITSSHRAQTASAETHRVTALSNLANALCHGDFTLEQTQRIKRLARSLEDAARESPQRKLEILQDTVIPTLISMGLIEEE